MGRKTLSMSAKVRNYLAKHPNAKAQEVSNATGATTQYVHNVRYADKKNEVSSATPATKKTNWKTLAIGTSKKSIKEAIARNSPEEMVGKSVGGLTLTREEGKGGFIYRWVKDSIASTIPVPKNIIAEHHTDMVNQPPHYKAGGMETIDFIEAKGLGYNLGNVVKYISRADLKGSHYEDLLKARWYLNREIAKFSPKTEVTK
jgi:hypothetical protein